MQSTEGRLGLGLGLELFRVRVRIRVRIRVSDPRWIASSAHRICCCVSEFARLGITKKQKKRFWKKNSETICADPMFMSTQYLSNPSKNTNNLIPGVTTAYNNNLLTI